MMVKRLSGLIILAAMVAVFGLIAPNAYVLDVAIRVMMNAIVVIGLNLLLATRGR